MADSAAQVREVVELLEADGFTVELVPGWETRGKGPMTTKGRIEHHTATNSRAEAPTLRVITFGHGNLKNSLSRWYVSRRPTIYLVALDTSWHAGPGIKGKNSTLSGTEAEHTGSLGELWSTEMLDAMAAISRAEARVFGFPLTEVWEHYEHAGHRGKIDRIGIKGPWWRARLLTGHEEDIMASIGDLERVVKAAKDELLAQIQDNEAHLGEIRRLAWSAALSSVSYARHELGLPPDPESDAVWADRIADGRATLAHAREALQPYAKIVEEVAAARRDAGLPPELLSDWEWLRRIRTGTHTLDDARAALGDRAAS